MKSTFPMRTGDVSYQIGLSPPAITGSWEVSMGFWGMNEDSWSISGVSGKIYDNSGYALGSYAANDYTKLEGVIAGSGHSIYQDGILLSNTAQQVPNDYNMVSIGGNYLEGYLPSVEIGGKEVLDNSLNQTVPFWRRETDNKLLFVTENAASDFGFIETLSGMGFYVKTGNLSGTFDPQYVKNQYGLIVFGSATTSGAYTNGAWNSLNMPMMSLNSHLVCRENLNWYGGVTSQGEIVDKTGVVYPERYFNPTGGTAIWAEFPIRGWQKLAYRANLSTTPGYSYYLSETDPWWGGWAGVGCLASFIYSAPNTTIYLSEYMGATYAPFHDGTGVHVGSGVFAGDIDPHNFTDALQQDYHINFTGIPGATGAPGVTTVISNTLGGTGAPDFSLTGTDWAHNQIFNLGRVIPQTATYNANNLYRRTTLTSGLYPTDQFNMYTGKISSSQGMGGDTLISNVVTGGLDIDPVRDNQNSSKLVTVWHHGFWTGQHGYAPEWVDPSSIYYTSSVTGGKFTVPELMVFSVTSTGMEWTGGYDMWSTLTTTGKQLFINAAAGFFIP